QKLPYSFTNLAVVIAFIAAMVIAILGLSTPKAHAASSYMLVDAPACVWDCPYGPEKILKRNDTVWMLCYRDMKWRYTNGVWSNRWYRVLSLRYPKDALYTPKPAVGNRISVSACR
ncbi:MAG: hypothetical protein M3Q70_03160, partial [bacterium]|nr:hypothetical protein [bacterium]